MYCISQLLKATAIMDVKRSKLYDSYIHCIRFFHQSHNTVHFGGLFTLKQWIISSVKHDTVPRVNKLHCFYVKNPPKRIALWDRENSQLEF